MEYNNFKNLKVGDVITIVDNPVYWTSHNGGRKGTERVEYPYTFIVQKIDIAHPSHPEHEHIAITCPEGYGWSIDKKTTNFFEVHNNNRKNRIKSLNL